MLLEAADNVKVGDVVPSRGRTITETDVVNFCYLTGNWLEIHSNVELASKTEFGQRLVQGSLVFSIIPGLVTWDPRFTRAFYGVERLRFIKPVFIGDTITTKVVVADVQVRDDDESVVTFDVEVLNQHGKTVQACQFRLLGRRRPLEVGR